MAEKGRDSNSPFDMLRNIGDMKDMRKMLGEDFFKNIPFPQWQQTNFNEDPEETVFPKVDVFDHGHELVVIVEIPGLTSSNEISLSIGAQEVFVKGVIGPIPSRGEGVYRTERYHGPFEREIGLPVRVEESNPQASYSRGLLTIRLNKRQTTETDTENHIPITFD